MLACSDRLIDLQREIYYEQYVDSSELESTKTENGRGELIEPENGLVSASKTRGEKLSTRDTKKIVKGKPVGIKTIH